MTGYVTAVDLGVEGIEATIRTKRGKRFKSLPRVLSSHELSMYWVLRKANLSVEPGDGVLVVADDPLMSTTFMRTLCGLLPADEGSVQGDSRSLLISAPKNRAIKGLSIRQTVFMLGGLYGMSDQEIADRADEVIDMAQVRDVLHSRIEESPRRIKHQISFSLAMVAPVDILAFTSSPIVGGPQFRPTCAGQLAHQRAQGKALLISTRDLDLAKQLCNKAIVLDQEESTTTSVSGAFDELERRAKVKKRQRRKQRRKRRASSVGDEPPGA